MEKEALQGAPFLIMHCGGRTRLEREVLNDHQETRHFNTSLYCEPPCSDLLVGRSVDVHLPIPAFQGPGLFTCVVPEKAMQLPPLRISPVTVELSRAITRWGANSIPVTEAPPVIETPPPLPIKL